jgi:hypothetical protein
MHGVDGGFEMDSAGTFGVFGAFAGLLIVLGVVILLVFLFWAPLKLYGIHSEAKKTNALLAMIMSRHDAQCNMLAVIAAKASGASTPPPPAL